MRVDWLRCVWKDSRSACGTTLGWAVEDVILSRLYPTDGVMCL